MLILPEALLNLCLKRNLRWLTASAYPFSNYKPMKNLSKIIQKPISVEWGVEGNSISVIRTINFTNEGKIDF